MLHLLLETGLPELVQTHVDELVLVQHVCLAHPQDQLREIYGRNHMLKAHVPLVQKHPQIPRTNFFLAVLKSDHP